MSSQTSTILRMMGLIIEVACAAIMIKVRGEGRLFLGISAETVLMCGFGVGFVMWAMSRTMVKRRKPTQRPLEF